MNAETQFESLLTGGKVSFPFASPPSIADLDASALGRLLPHALLFLDINRPGGKAWEAAQGILQQSRQLQPRYDADSAVRMLETLCILATAESVSDDTPSITLPVLSLAAETIEGLSEAPSPKHRALIGKLIDLPHKTNDRALPPRSSVSPVPARAWSRRRRRCTRSNSI